MGKFAQVRNLAPFHSFFFGGGQCILTVLVLITAFTVVSSGASCEANGFGNVKSLGECKTAPQELNIQVTEMGAVNSNEGPTGCYLRFDGDLWYNKNGQSTVQCSSKSKCVCKNGKEFCS